MSQASKIVLIFQRQVWHAVLAAVLLVGVGLSQRLAGVSEGELAGVSMTAWMWWAVLVAVAHQVHVWFCWRTELHASLISRVLGRHGFFIYGTVFSILGITRVVLVFLVAIANQDTLPLPLTWTRPLAVLLMVPTVYLFYSVARYFGFQRALGRDHFDPSYRTKPFVRQGIFRFTSNGMYTFGFLLLWIPGLWFGSAAALIVALFNHLYIWVHFFCTERVDMQVIYGRNG